MLDGSSYTTTIIFTYLLHLNSSKILLDYLTQFLLSILDIHIGQVPLRKVSVVYLQIHS